MDLNWIKTRPIAHRGLHDANKGIMENSPAAFEAAIASGYPIELDLQVTSDEEALVFHDVDLDRMTTMTGKVFEHASSEIKKQRIKGSTETVPTFGEILELVNGRAPILIEIKNRRAKAGPLEARTASLLNDYKGEFAVQGFSPYSMGWFAENHPAILRGQLSQSYITDPGIEFGKAKRFILRNMLLNFISKPHFIAYRINALPQPSAARARRGGLPLVAWTVKTTDERRLAAANTDNIIFENFRPELNKGAAFDE